MATGAVVRSSAVTSTAGRYRLETCTTTRLTTSAPSASVWGSNRLAAGSASVIMLCVWILYLSLGSAVPGVPEVRTPRANISIHAVMNDRNNEWMDE